MSKYNALDIQSRGRIEKIRKANLKILQQTRLINKASLKA